MAAHGRDSTAHQQNAQKTKRTEFHHRCAHNRRTNRDASSHIQLRRRGSSLKIGERCPTQQERQPMIRTTRPYVFHDIVLSHDPLRLHPCPFHCSPEALNSRVKRPIGGYSPNSRPLQQVCVDIGTNSAPHATRESGHCGRRLSLPTHPAPDALDGIGMDARKSMLRSCCQMFSSTRVFFSRAVAARVPCPRAHLAAE